ncbi:MAG: hypothetical protein IJU19_00840 [Bacteroidales bacterium]|nr:hypothetical protein [Bacteroidales bacterium]
MLIKEGKRLKSSNEVEPYTLMCGDWIDSSDGHLQVEEVCRTANSICIYSPYADGCLVGCGLLLYGIPITHRRLAKNGFRKIKGKNVREFDTGKIEEEITISDVEDGTWHLIIGTIKNGHDIEIECNVRFFHELQQALRFASIRAKLQP